jgi:hypothetical protein
LARPKIQAETCSFESAALAKSEIERTLRARAFDAAPRSTLELSECTDDRRAAIEILADFYEHHGQPSRAALWREQLSNMGDGVPDLLTRTPRPQAFDTRRAQMIWLLRKQGVSVRKVGAAFGLSATRVEQIVAGEDAFIRSYARNEQLRPTLKATERLVAAGALPGDRPTRPRHQESWFDLCEMPPEDWPAEHMRRRG